MAEEAVKEDFAEGELVKRRRIVVKSIRVKKEDLSKLTGAGRESVLDGELFANVEGEVVLEGPWKGERTGEQVVVKECRILREVDYLPESIVSHKRPEKKTTALLWSRSRFMKRLYELKNKRRK
jgi:hypothetical protein